MKYERFYYPPRILEWVLSKIYPDRECFTSVGDFAELYNRRVHKDGLFMALLWYFWQLISSIPYLLKNKIYWGIQMFKNYAKIAFRNFVNQKTVSIINITGLAIGLAVSILIMLWVQHELSFEEYHPNKNKIYRVLQHQFFDGHSTWAITQGPLAPALKKEFPEIEDYTRLVYNRPNFSFSNETYNESGIHVDPSYFHFFETKFLLGDSSSALKNVYSVILTKRFANNIFGKENPIGQTLKLNDQYDVQVTAVIENPPTNSTIQYSFLSTMELAKEIGYTVDRWSNSAFFSFIMIGNIHNRNEFVNKIENFLEDKPTLEKGAKLDLQPLTDMHFNHGYDFEFLNQGNPQYVVILFTASLFILIIACINFMNLATARSLNRSKEVGLRKTIGARKEQIVKQYLNESVLLTLVSFFLAITIVFILLPHFNEISGKNFTTHDILTPSFILFILLIVLATGILSGFYPAFVISSYSPINMLRDKLPNSSRATLRKGLVILQFSITIILLIGTMGISEQISFLKNADLGFQKENVVTLPLNGISEKDFRAFKNDIEKMPAVYSFTSTTNIPIYGYTFSNSLWRWEGQNEAEQTLIRANYVGPNYFETFEMEILEGRAFSENYPSDTLGIMLNESALKQVGYKEPIGKIIRYEGEEDIFTIIGIVKDFNYKSLHGKIEPMFILYYPGKMNWACLKIAPENLENSLSLIKQIWEKFSDADFNYSFLDERLNEQYHAEMRVEGIFSYFAILAIIVSCLGLFGISSFIVEKKSKEISIRKVLGCSTQRISLFLMKEFLIWVLIANIIALPIAYYLMDKWLEGFAYHAEIELSSFIISTCIVFLVALSSVFIKVIKAANKNPIDNIRYE